MLQLEVAPGIILVEGDRRGRFPYGNVLVLEGTERRVLVDTGSGDEILAAVAARGPVDVIFNTHYHIDHVRGNGRFLGAAGPAFWCPAGEAPALASWEGFLSYTGFDLPVLRDAGDAHVFRQGLGWVPTPVAHELADGEVLDLGRLEAVALRLPGHTPGHTGLLFPAQGVVFAADIDLSSFGPWYGDVFSGVDDYLASIRRLGAAVDELAGGGRRPVTVLTSHRRPLTYETFKERLPRFVARVAERDERILALLAAEGPLTLAALAGRWPVYGPETAKLPGIWKSEYFMVKHHLERLARAGRVESLGVRPGDSPGGLPAAAAADKDRVSEDKYGGTELWRAV